MIQLPETKQGKQIVAIRPRTPGNLHLASQGESDEVEWIVLAIAKVWTDPKGVKTFDYVVFGMNQEGETFNGDYFEHRSGDEHKHTRAAWGAFNER